MNITKSSTIDTLASVWIDGATFQMNGVFATIFKSFTLQSNGVILEHIYDRNFSKMELNGELINPVFISGMVLFTVDNGIECCPVELRRVAGNLCTSQFY